MLKILRADADRATRPFAVDWRESCIRVRMARTQSIQEPSEPVKGKGKDDDPGSVSG